MTSALVLPRSGVDLDSTLGALAMLPGDPTLDLQPGRLHRATTTPQGPATLEVCWDGGDDITATAWGDGARWLLERAPRLLGLEDDASGFAPDGPLLLRDLWRRYRGDRVGASGTLWHDLAWTVVQQRVSRADAAAQWRRMVTTLGTDAPGPTMLRLPPEPDVVARMSYADLHALGVERRRADALIAAARAVRRLEDLVDGPLPEAALRAVPGVGPWTTGCLAAHTWGDADTLLEGDDGIPSRITWLFKGVRRGGDADMRALLEPHRPHRYRVVRLAMRAPAPPRHGPRRAPHDGRRR